MITSLACAAPTSATHRSQLGWERVPLSESRSAWLPRPTLDSDRHYPLPAPRQAAADTVALGTTLGTKRLPRRSAVQTALLTLSSADPQVERWPETVIRSLKRVARGGRSTMRAVRRKEGASSVGTVSTAFLRDVAPVLLKRCNGCHGERANLGGYRIHTFSDLIRPGASGRAPIVPDQPEQSALLQRVTASDPSLRMPKGDDPLPPQEVAVLRNWIQAGARFDGPDPRIGYRDQMGPRRHPAAPAVYRTPVPVLALAFAPGGKELVTGGYHEVLVWNPATGALLRRLPRLPQRIRSLTYSPDGATLLVAGGTPGEYGDVALIDPATGAVRRVLDTFGDLVLSAAFSADGRHVAAGGADGSVRLYDVQTGRRRWQARVHADWVTAVSFSADGKFVASGSRDMAVKVYDAADGSLFTTYSGHNRQIGEHAGQSPVYALRFVPADGDGPAPPTACSAGGGRWVQMWDPANARAENGDAGDMEERFARKGHARYLPHGFAKEVFALAVRAGQVFAAGADGVVRQFDVASLREVRTYEGGADWLFALDFDPATARIAAGSYTGEIRVWDTHSGQPVTVFRAQPGRENGPR